MAIKKSQLYSHLWKSCDELRGAMDPSQYKDYVLVMLLVRYASDKYAGVPYAPIIIPEGSSFKDLVALKGKTTIGDDINKKIIEPIAKANKLSEMPDFDNDEKLGSGKEKVERLTKLIAIFEHPDLNFSKNRAGDDDLLGDAYEYLMRLFATESGKSKGQFYTPAEVSRIIAKVIGINSSVKVENTVYDPTCGSGSLLLKVADETKEGITIYGQESDSSTKNLARMNMILHDNAAADIRGGGSTLSNPQFLDANGQLKAFDFVVANPPFSSKSWKTGVDTDKDPYNRFKEFGVPPKKNGDYAFLLHIIRSMKPRGKGACILPHGVLFRGNAEAEIRQNIVKRGYIKAIIGLPANLFYGTGIPACIVVLDKEGAATRTGIFMIDASKDFIKDGNKNRLRAQDIHKIVDVFSRQLEIPKYSRFVSNEEIQKNDYNLNLPRYIDSQEPEDLQDIDAHLRGGIPERDVEDLNQYWTVYPQLRHALFKDNGRKGYLSLQVKPEDVKHTIFSHPEFTAHTQHVEKLFNEWVKQNEPVLRKLTVGSNPKETIHTISEALLSTFASEKLINRYDIYQKLMEYWADIMQDDVYIIASDGWKAQLAPLPQKEEKEGKTPKKPKKIEYDCDLVPKSLVKEHYFAKDKQALEKLEEERGELQRQMDEIEEENSGEEGVFASFDKVSKKTVAARYKEIAKTSEDEEECKVLQAYLALAEKASELDKRIKEGVKALDTQVEAKYSTLKEKDVQEIVIQHKWLRALQEAVNEEMSRVSQRLAHRIKQLAERYETPLPVLLHETQALTAKVEGHLKKMRYNW